MKILHIILFLIGMLAYITSLIFFGSNLGESFSDIGNAMHLINVSLYVVRKYTKTKVETV